MFELGIGLLGVFGAITIISTILVGDYVLGIPDRGQKALAVLLWLIFTGSSTVAACTGLATTLYAFIRG